jgi:hypothetical protein
VTDGLPFAANGLPFEPAGYPPVVNGHPPEVIGPLSEPDGHSSRVGGAKFGASSSGGWYAKRVRGVHK